MGSQKEVNHDGQIIKFTNCYLLRNHEIIKDDLWIRKRKIVNPEVIFFCEKSLPTKIIDCGGCLIAPGFIDLQINGGYGIDFTSDTGNVDEGITIVANSITADGVTAFCPTLVSSKPAVYKKILPALRKRMGGAEGAAVLGVHLEGPFITPDENCSQNQDALANFSEDYKSVTDIYGPMNNVCIVTLAPEIPNALDMIEQLVLRRYVVSLGHSLASVDVGEEAVSRGATFVNHLFHGMRKFHCDDPGLLGLIATPKARDFHYGLICDRVHVHAAWIRITYRANPEGCVLISDAMSGLGLPEGTHNFGDKQVDIRDGVPFLSNTNTICGSVTSFIDCVKFLKECTDCSLAQALEAGSLHPAKVLKLERQKGTLNYRADADFIMLNDDLEVLETWVGGHRAYRNKKPVSRAFSNKESIVNKQLEVKKEYCNYEQPFMKGSL